jgi:hypothetical protein
MTMKFTLNDTARIMGHVRRRMEELQPNSMQFYEDAAAMLAAQAPVGHQPGYYIGPNNVPVRIPNSIPLEHGGGARETIAKPLSVATVDAIDVDEVPEPELVALPSPLAEETDDIAQEARRISATLDGEAGDEVDGDGVDDEDDDVDDDEDVLSNSLRGSRG